MRTMGTNPQAAQTGAVQAREACPRQPAAALYPLCTVELTGAALGVERETLAARTAPLWRALCPYSPWNLLPCSGASILVVAWASSLVDVWAPCFLGQEVESRVCSPFLSRRPPLSLVMASSFVMCAPPLPLFIDEGRWVSGVRAGIAGSLSNPVADVPWAAALG